MRHKGENKEGHSVHGDAIVWTFSLVLQIQAAAL